MTTLVASYSHKFQVDIKEGQGEAVYGEKFSPLPGYLFQLRILNLDTERFCVYLINCGEEEVEISTFKVKSASFNIEAEKNNFSLLPGGSMAVTDLSFYSFVLPSSRLCSLSLHKEDFYCCLEFDINIKGKTVLTL